MFDSVLFLSQLQQKTLSKEIRWEIAQELPRSLANYSNDYIVTCFSHYDVTTQSTFYIYTYRTKYYTDEDEYHFVTYNNLAIINNDQIIYEFGNVSEVSNLINQIQSLNLSNMFQNF